MFQGSYVPQLSIVLMCGIKENVLRNVYSQGQMSNVCFFGVTMLKLMPSKLSTGFLT